MYHPIPLSFPTLAERGFFCAPYGVSGHSGPHERLLGRRVLIVEDEALLALELELVFSEEGADVIGPALSLSHGMTLVESTGEIDCAVLDVDLGGRDVFPIAHALEARGVPFVFHTAHAKASTLALLFPSSETIAKPARPEDLVTRLAALTR